MSSASHAHPGSSNFGGLLVKILIIAVIWTALVLGTMHYVGNVWPKAIQVSQAEDDAATEKAKEALTPPKAEAPVSAATSGSAAPLAKASTPSAPAPAAAAPAASTTATTAPAAGSAAAASAAPGAGSATPAASAPKATGEQKLPKDPSLAGYDRSAMWNVAVFYSIVISVFCVGAMIMQVYKHCHIEEEEHAH